MTRSGLVRRAGIATLAGLLAFLVLEGAGQAGGGDPEKALPTVRTDSVRDFSLPALDGTLHGLAETRGASAIVLAWTAPGCPVAMVYAPRLATLATTFAPRGVRFFGVDSDHGAPLDELRALAASSALPYPILLDADGALAQRLSVTTTTTVVVLDANWRVRYRGALDDQYAVGGRKERPERAYLVDALEAVLAAKPVPVETTPAPGCPITFAPAAKAPSADAPTWNGRIGRILHARCLACHQPGQGGPFTLLSSEDARSRLATMRAAVAEDRMPPWHALGPKGHWANDRRLDPEEKRDVLAWIDAGGPEGDAASAPPAPALLPPDHWQIGAPDAVLAFSEAEEVPAEGVVPYRYVQIPTNYDEDRFVSAIEIQPGAPDVVHHVLVATMPPGSKRRSSAFAPTSGFFSAMVPGGRVSSYPAGMGKRLPKGATLLFQMHYTPNGIAQRDLTRIGLRFLEGPPEQEVYTSGAFAPQLKLAPGDPRCVVRAALPVPFDVRVLSFMPHMHVRGTSFQYAFRTASGVETTICEVPRYDFNWQTPYRLAEPVAIPKGSFLLCVATFDNSAGNPYNPDPTATVRWGDQTWDEMMIGYVDYVRPTPP